MTTKFADFVKETTSQTGTGTYQLNGAASGFRTFVAGVGSGAEVFLAVTDGTDWEVGRGTVTSGSPDTLSRDSILASSNAGSAVSWSSGAKDVYLVNPAEWIGGVGFHVDKNGTGQNSISDATETQLTWSTERFDRGGDFASNQFTAPHDGIYLFVLALQVQSATNLVEARALIRKGGTTVLFGRGTPVGGNAANALAVGTLLLDAGDVIDAAVLQDSDGAANVDGSTERTYFQGFRIGV